MKIGRRAADIYPYHRKLRLYLLLLIHSTQMLLNVPTHNIGLDLHSLIYPKVRKRIMNKDLDES